MEKTVQALVQELKKMSVAVTDKELSSVATVSAGGSLTDEGASAGLCLQISQGLVS